MCYRDAWGWQLETLKRVRVTDLVNFRIVQSRTHAVVVWMADMTPVPNENGLELNCTG